VLSTLHTTGAVKTIDRVIDVFPPHQQQQIRMQLSMTLVGIVSQQLLLSTDHKNRVVAVETLIATPAIRNLIRENKAHQVASAMQSASASGMQLMDNALSALYHEGRITRDAAITYAVDKNYIATLL
jgi:twitching motility protein PilT